MAPAVLWGGVLADKRAMLPGINLSETVQRREQEQSESVAQGPLSSPGALETHFFRRGRKTIR